MLPDTSPPLDAAGKKSGCPQYPRLPNVFKGMHAATPTTLMTNEDHEITATVLRETSRLGDFIRRRVGDQTDVEDILQDVFHAFVESYRLPAPIEQVSAWLFRVARNRIVDGFRKKREQRFVEPDDAADDDGDVRLDLVLPAQDAGPAAVYERALLLKALQEAIDELPASQRDVFVAHELEGIPFKEMAARTGVAVNTLLSRKRYAVLFLRRRLQEIYDEIDE